jgi:hypothetical protein
MDVDRAGRETAEPDTAGSTDTVAVGIDAGPETGRIVTVDVRADIAVAAAAVTLGVLLIVLSADIRQGNIDDPIGAGGFARVLGAFMACVGALLVGRRLLGWRRDRARMVYADGAPGDEPGHTVSAGRPFVLLAMGLSWALLLPQIGYLVPTCLISLATMLLMRVRRPLPLIAVSLGFSLLTWVLFTRISGLRFPSGPVENFFADIIPRLD